MSLQQNINNSIFSLAHLNLLQSVSKEPKDYKEMRQLIEDINAGKYTMTPEEIKEAEKIYNKNKTKLKRNLEKVEKEFQERKNLEENEKLTNEVNRLRKAKPKLTADEAELLARENIAKKQAEYEKSREKRMKKSIKQFERDRKHGKLGF